MVPEGWAKHRIGDVANIQVGKDLNLDSFSPVRTEKHCYPVYSNTVEDRGLYGFYDTPEYAANSFTVVGRGIGLGTAFSRDHPYGAIGRLLVISPKDNSFDYRFLAEYVNFCLRLYDESGGIPQLPGSRFANYDVVLPPLLEQQKIAAILSTWDITIETIEELIQNSVQQKKALMQHFFSTNAIKGVRRAELGSLGTFRKGKGITREQLASKGLPCVRYGELYTHHHNIIRSFVSFIAPDMATNAATIKKGDILFANSGETSEDIGKCAVFLGNHEAYAGGDIVIFSPREGDPKFLAYQLNDRSVVQQKVRFAQGHSVVHINAASLAKIELLLPNLTEQARIASVLEQCDRIIEGYSKQRDVLLTEKQALMQQLLTGKRRVRVDDAVESAYA